MGENLAEAFSDSNLHIFGISLAVYETVDAIIQKKEWTDWKLPSRNTVQVRIYYLSLTSAQVIEVKDVPKFCKDYLF